MLLDPLAAPVPFGLPDVPVLLDPLAAPEVPPVGPEFGLFVAVEVDAGELGVVVGLAPVELDVGPGVAGRSVWLGVAVALQRAVPVALAIVSLPAAFRLAFVESVLVPVAVAFAVVGVAVAVVLPVAVAVAVLLAPPAGLVAEPAGVTLGVADLLGLAAADDAGAAAGEGVDGHAVALGLLWPLVVLPGLLAPLDEPPKGLEPVPARLGGPLVLGEEMPATWPASWPIWTRA